MQIGNFRLNIRAAMYLSAFASASVVARFAACISRSAFVSMVLLGATTLLAQEGETSYSRLGVPEIHSPLGSPLWVKIPVESSDSAAEFAASRFSLGPRPLNAEIPFVENAEISVERRGNKNFLVIRSRQPVDDLAFGLVVREQLLKGVRSRVFTLLLDPPILFDATAAERATEPAQSSNTAQLPEPVKLPAQVVAAPQAQIALKAPSVNSTASVPRARRTRNARATGAPRTDVAVAAAVTTSSGAAATPTPARNRSNNAAIRTDAAAATRKPASTPTNAQLHLTLSTDSLSALPSATEETRAELRRRQLIMDTDDLTSALLERTHRIGLLETELARLAARVTATERTLNVSRPVAATDATATTTPTPIAQSSAVAAAPVTATEPVAQTPVVAQAPRPAVARAASPKVAATSQSLPTWVIVMFSIAALLLTGVAFWEIRQRLRAREREFRIVPQEATDYVAEALAQSPKQPVRHSAVAAVVVEKPLAVNVETPERLLAPAVVVAEASLPEIHFELPELPVSSMSGPVVAQDLPVARPALSDIAEDADGTAGKTGGPIASDDLRGRRMRYLQCRYHDIAIMMPPLDAPQRLLNQAGRIYDEGAADFAKRLLKYAVYSRPYAEEFWLALFDLLRREKLANDYLVNAKWFREYHPQSGHWDEVQRIGYLLDPRAPIFASAAAWSHEEPAAGLWLPANRPETKTVVPSRMALTLELTN